MPDTGAPWNIPYVENADLVSDWPADSLLVANAVAAGLTAANTGIGSNVVQTVKTDTFSTSSATYTALTGLSASITPSSATAKVLVMVDLKFSNTTNNQTTHVRLVRGATVLYVGNADGNRTQTSAATGGASGEGTQLLYNAGIITFLDSPASAASTTYGVEIRVGGGTAVVNRALADDNLQQVARTASSITLIEVAA
jgi:hypothetical protein